LNGRIFGRSIRTNLSLRRGRRGFRFVRFGSHQHHLETAAEGPNSSRARQAKLTLEINSLTPRLKLRRGAGLPLRPNAARGFSYSTSVGGSGTSK
jgi:hypothetical protein